MLKLMEAQQDLKAFQDRQQELLDTAQRAGRHLSEAERLEYTTLYAASSDLELKIRNRELQSTIRTAFPSGMPGMGLEAGFDAPVAFGRAPANAPVRNYAATRTQAYSEGLIHCLRTNGREITEELRAGGDGEGGFHIPGSERFTGQRAPNGSYTGPRASAAMYEGSQGSSNAAGGYAISVPTWDQIVPLALPDLGIFNASLVVPTVSDTKIPQQASFGTSAIKSESNATVAQFGGTDPTLQQTLLASFMVGASRVVSWELLQDVAEFQEFVVNDLIRGQQITEGQLFATGTGIAQPLGVFGNTGNGTGAAYELLGTSADGMALLNSLFDVTSTLKAAYQPNASWIMSRSTGLTIKRAQMQANLFAPVATTDPDGTERILGRPVFYDVNAPSLPTATTAGVTPILFGDFRQGNIIGVRGGAGINIKILDQPLALSGQLAILAYRRVDSRIRRSEAIQAITISHI